MYTKRQIRYSILIASLLLFLWGSTSSSLSAQSVIPASEQAALLEIYDQCGGTQWAEGFNWRAASSPDKYLGVIIQDGHVQGIALDGVGLTGQLPKSFFTALPELRFVGLSNNKLSGSIPEAFGSMTKLQALMLSNNDWSGELPNLDRLVNLEVLHLADFSEMDQAGRFTPHVTGTLPDISKMPHLVALDASFSFLSGELPEQIGNCKKLQVLELSYNKLTGSLPASIAKCTDLQILSVQHNEMSGEIPDLSTLIHLGEPLEAGMGMTEPGRLYLNENKFTGPFPESVVMLPRLTRFSCANNQLSGELPRDLRTMMDLEILFINNNQFTGSLPDYLPEKLHYVDFANNQLTGSIPATWQEAKELGKISLHHNNLSGEVPPVYNKLANLDMVDLRNCRYAFADLKAWRSFIRDKETIFRFGMQQAYSTLQQQSVSAGAEVTFDATYPGALIGDEHYRWYNMTTLTPVPNANEAQLQLSNVSKQDACRYVCLITSVKMGSTQPRSALREMSTRAADDGLDLQPTLRSGFYELTVDGYFNGITTPTVATPADLQLYYDQTTQQLHLHSVAAVASLMVVDLSGSVIARLEHCTTSALDLPLPAGKYVVLANLTDGGIATASLLVL